MTNASQHYQAQAVSLKNLSRRRRAYTQSHSPVGITAATGVGLGLSVSRGSYTLVNCAFFKMSKTATAYS